MAYGILKKEKITDPKNKTKEILNMKKLILISCMLMSFTASAKTVVLCMTSPNDIFGGVQFSVDSAGKVSQVSSGTGGYQGLSMPQCLANSPQSNLINCSKTYSDQAMNSVITHNLRIKLAKDLSKSSVRRDVIFENASATDTINELLGVCKVYKNR